MINVLISSQMCINELQMANDHTYAKDHNRELRILKEKFDLVLSEDEENNEIPGNVSGSSGTNSCVLQADLGQGEEEGDDITFPLSQDPAPESEEEGAGFSFMPSQNLAAEGEREGRSRDCEEVEAQEPGTERSSVVKPELTSDQKTFLITQKSRGARLKDILSKWSTTFKRAPPSARTVGRILKREREENSILSRKFNCGRKRSVRTKEMIEQVKRTLKEESEATPNMRVNRGRNNQWNLNRQTFYRIMKDIEFRPYVVRQHQVISPANIQKRLLNSIYQIIFYSFRGLVF